MENKLVSSNDHVSIGTKLKVVGICDGNDSLLGHIGTVIEVNSDSIILGFEDSLVKEYKLPINPKNSVISRNMCYWVFWRKYMYSCLAYVDTNVVELI